MPRHEKAHTALLAHLLKGFVAERFKRMARDEVLFKFLSSRIDPAVLVDHALQAEKEALDLTEMSLLQLVDSKRMEQELFRSGEKIQNAFQKIFGDDISKEFNSERMIEKRTQWLAVRVDFYRKWISLSDDADSPKDLAAKAFRQVKTFEASLAVLHAIDKEFAEELIKSTNALYRFLMRKQMEHETQRSIEVWEEFKKEAFHKPAALP